MNDFAVGFHEDPPMLLASISNLNRLKKMRYGAVETVEISSTNYNPPLITGTSVDKTVFTKHYAHRIFIGLALSLILIFFVYACDGWTVYDVDLHALVMGPSRIRDHGTATSAGPPNIRVWNNYEKEYGMVLSDGWLKWDHLVQIYKETTLEVVDPQVDEKTCRWTTPDGITLDGCSVIITFSQVGTNEVILSFDGTSYAYSIVAKYVRWEIRKLWDIDRNEFFDALATTYGTSQADGEKLYGSKYRSNTYLVEKHLLGAADKSCDHWHDDAGIYTHHSAFTLELEQSLQSINPRVAVPYWDYTYDEYIHLDWTESEIFTNDWFGVASPLNDNHVLTSGRWAYTKVAIRMGNTGDERTHNPYGLLRSPWNTNPIPYLLRSRFVLGAKDGNYRNVPGCKEFSSFFQKTELSELLAGVNGLLHGPIHIMVGGQWHFEQEKLGVEKLFKKSGLVEMGRGAMVNNFLLMSKFMWRQGYVKCPTVCSSDTPGEQCTCFCPSTIPDWQLNAQNSGMNDLTRAWVTKLKNAGNTTEHEIWHELCHIGWAGEMYTSAAPLDPIFWPLHGLADKFINMKRLMKDAKKTVLDESWGFEHMHNVPSDTGIVCDWSDVKGEFQIPNCTRGTCPGHKEFDIIPFGNFTGTDAPFYTNRAFYEFSYPNNDAYPYIYDSYTDWPGCAAQNISWWDV